MAFRFEFEDFMRVFALLCALLFASVAAAQPPKTLYWEDLIPEGEIEELERLYDAYYANIESKMNTQDWQSMFEAGSDGVAEGSALDFMPQLGTFNVVEELDGAHVRIPGFVLPFEYSASGNIREFLLVPYFGACIHTPPPPPNQLVYVTAEKPVPLGEQWDAIWATGVLRATRNMNDLGNAAYTLEIKSWETYDG
ncbi:MAG: DUF3299 domain-containing protein [Pseudomonadota bacterium]